MERYMLDKAKETECVLEKYDKSGCYNEEIQMTMMAERSSGRMVPEKI